MQVDERAMEAVNIAAKDVVKATERAFGCHAQMIKQDACVNARKVAAATIRMETTKK